MTEYTQAQIDRENAELRIGSIVRDGENRMFERFDDLHKRNINDDTIIHVLRSNGRPELAAQYIEWSGALDPDAEDDNTTMNPVVPDPGDSESNELIQAYTQPIQSFVFGKFAKPEADK